MKIRMKRTLCRALGWLALLAMLVLVGGTEQGWLPLGRGMAAAIASELVGAALLWKGGVIRVR